MHCLRSRLLAIPLALCGAGLLVACEGDGTGTPPGEVPIEPFPGRFQVSTLPAGGDATQGEPIEGASILYGQEEKETDDLGVAEFIFEGNVTFEARIIVDLGTYPTYHVTGRSGTGDPNFFVPIGLETHETLATLVESLGATIDSSLGLVVVALETPALQRVLDASVTIEGSGAPLAFIRQNTDVSPGDDDDDSGDDDDSATSEDTGATEGTTLGLYSQSTVTFANVAPGTHTLSITAPAGDACLAHPGVSTEGDLREVTVRAAAVTYIRYICD